jgi:hypothetical protein
VDFPDLSTLQITKLHTAMLITSGMKVYTVLAGQIYRQLQHFLTDQTDQLSARQKSGLDPEGWMTLHLKQVREMQAEMKVGCMNVLLSVWQLLQLPSNGTNPKLEPDGEGV